MAATNSNLRHAMAGGDAMHQHSVELVHYLSAMQAHSLVAG